jgi:hypothetical protein
MRLLNYKMVTFVLGVLIVMVARYQLDYTQPQIVTQVSPESAQKLHICNNSLEADRFACYEAYFKLIIHQNGASEALKQLAELKAKEQYVEAQCHSLVHSIGHDAYKFYGSVSESTKYSSEVCWSGYYHGIMESYMSEFDDSQLLAKINSICQPEPGKSYSFAYYNCWHGVGHGVTIRFENDIFKAMPFCEAISPEWERKSCYSGVFMQNIVVDGEAHKSVNLKPEDPVYPCNVVREDQKESCYLMVTSYILKTVMYDYAKAFSICDSVEPNYLSSCYKSMGRDISAAAFLAPERVIALCELGNAPNRSDCYNGAVSNAIYNDHNTIMADALCRALSETYRQACIVARNQANSVL